MLVVSRKLGQTIKIGDITVTIVKVGESVKLGIDAPKDVPVVRDDAKEKERKAA